MKCSNCGHDMIQSRKGWLCLSCGHVEADASAPATSQAIALGKEGHAQMRAAATPVLGEAPPATEAAANVDAEAAASAAEPAVPTEPATPVAAEAADAAPPADAPEAAPPASPAAPPDTADTPGAPASSSSHDAAAADVPAPPPAPAAPWSETTPAADPTAPSSASETAPAEAAPAPESESEVSAPADGIEPNPSAADLQAMEQALAQVEHPEAAEAASESQTASAPAPQAETEAPQPELPAIKKDTKKARHKGKKPDAEAAVEPASPVAPPPPSAPEATPPGRPIPPVPVFGRDPLASVPPAAAESPESLPPAAISSELPPATPAEQPRLIAHDVPASMVAAAPPPPAAPPLTPVTHPRPVNLGLTLSVIAGLIILILLAAAGYFLLLAPKLALGQYLQRLTHAKTAVFAAATTDNSSELRFAMRMDGKYNLADEQNPQVDVNLTGQLSGAPSISTTSSGGLSGQVILVNHTLYFKLDSLSFLAQLLPADIAGTWYKNDLSQSQASKCNTQGKTSASWLGDSVLSQLPVKSTAFAGLADLGGAKTLHYRGVVDYAKVKAAIDRANQSLPADCKIEVTADDYKNLATTYELWHGWSKDRLKLTFTNTSTKATNDVVLDTGSYNKAVTITAPTGAKDASEMLKGLLGSDSGAALGAATQAAASAPPTSPRPAASAAARDTQRQADLSAYAAAYKATAQRGFYTLNPPAVTVSAVDPSTGQAYAVGKTAPTGLGQIQYKPGGQCSGPSITPGATGTRYLALYTQLEGSTTPYCLDVK